MIAAQNERTDGCSGHVGLGFKRHQKWPCVVGIGASVEDRGRPLVLKWRLEGALWGSAFGQLLSAKGHGGARGGAVKFRAKSALRTAKLMI